MKIDGLPNIITIQNKRKMNQYENSFSSMGNDDLAVSDLGRLSLQVEAAVKKAPELRSERVKEIQQAINSGTYKIDAQSIAKKMLEL